MIRNVTMWTLALLVAFAASAFAGDGNKSGLSETFSLWGGNTPAVDFFVRTTDVVGARAQLHIPVGQGQHWTLSPGLSYGYGSWKDHQTSVPSSLSPYPPTSDQLTDSYLDAMLDLLYYRGGRDDAKCYCGPGLFYSSLTLTEKMTGMRDVRYNPYRTLGVQMTAGGGIPLSPRVEMTGSLVERAGMSSFDLKGASYSYEDKFTSIAYSTQFSAGLRFHY